VYTENPQSTTNLANQTGGKTDLPLVSGYSVDIAGDVERVVDIDQAANID